MKERLWEYVRANDQFFPENMCKRNRLTLLAASKYSVFPLGGIVRDCSSLWCQGWVFTSITHSKTPFRLPAPKWTLIFIGCRDWFKEPKLIHSERNLGLLFENSTLPSIFFYHESPLLFPSSLRPLGFEGPVAPFGLLFSTHFGFLTDSSSCMALNIICMPTILKCILPV